MTALCLFLVLLFTANSPAFAGTTIDTRGDDPIFQVKSGLKRESLTDLEMLAAFESPEDEPYTLGRGDVLKIDFWERPEMSGQHVIGPDGRITLPYVGPTQLDRLTRDEAHAAVNRTVESYYLNPIFTIKVEEYASNRVYILGRVTHPGLLQFQTQPTLLEAITRAGGLPIGGVGADKASLTRCAIFRGRERVVWVDLKSLLTGNLNYNLRLMRDDIVYIPDSDDQLIYVLGEVERPGAYRLTPEMSFLDALSTAGGPTDDGNIDGIKVIRSGLEVRRNIDLTDIIGAESGHDVLLEEHDIIYVPKTGLAKFSYVLKHLNPLASVLLLGTALSK